jgi:hypothetical protein
MKISSFTLCLFFSFLLSCNSGINSPEKTKIDSETINNNRQNNENLLINFERYSSDKSGKILLEYSINKQNTGIIVDYSIGETLKSQIKSFSLSSSNNGNYQIININEGNKSQINKISAELQKLNVSDPEKKEELSIVADLINGKEISFYLDQTNLMPGKSFIEFKSLNSQNEFNLSIKEPGYYFKQINTLSGLEEFTINSDFFINKEGNAVNKIDNFLLSPQIQLTGNQIIRSVDNLGNVSISEVNGYEIPLTRIYVYYFKNYKSLKELGNSLFAQSSESGKPEEINLKEFTIKERYKYRK